MELVKPELGLIFWMTITFVIILTLLKKFAWPVILNSIKDREKSIEQALLSAEQAKKEMGRLQKNNEKLIADARQERDNLLKEAREIKDSIINEAKAKAQQEADRLLASARENITNEKNAAIAELKGQVANLSIEIAEKILKTELSNEERQKTLIKNLLNDVKLN